jgi:hypothetical protein
VPAQGGAILISLLGNGKALEVARISATHLLPADNEKQEGRATWQELGYRSDLKLWPQALSTTNGVLKLHLASKHHRLSA